MATPKIPQRRTTDNPFSMLVRLWDWIDRRQIDAHVVAAIILIGSIKLLTWAMNFANANPGKSGLEVAAIIGAVMVPWSALQAAAIKFYFDTRQNDYT